MATTALLEDHQCPWVQEAQLWRERAERAEQEQCESKARIAQLEELVIKIVGELDVLKRRNFGQSSEKVEREIKKRQKPPLDPQKIQEKRRKNRASRLEFEEVKVPIPVPAEQRHCDHCGREREPMGPGKTSTVFEYVPAKLIRVVHIRETLTCPCCEGSIVTAPPPPKVIEKGEYGPALIANTLVEKCLDALPLYRQAKRYRRLGLPLSRSTLCDLFHQAAALLRPIWLRLKALVALQWLVQADETTLNVVTKGIEGSRRAFIWAFLAWLETGELLVVVVFSPSRSGETPREVLGASTGCLIVDAYTGYNAVCTLEGRDRGGCWAHVRRKFFDALTNAEPPARVMLALIFEIYLVEHEACEQRITGSEAHLALRKDRSAKAVEKIKEFVASERPKHTPKSPMGNALGYVENQWESLTLFLTDARIPIDNNASERVMKLVALGRKNYLFVGNDTAGEDLAVVLTLVTCCESLGINPQDYLADVLLKVSQLPSERLGELLPQNWKAAKEKEKQRQAALERAITPIGISINHR